LSPYGASIVKIRDWNATFNPLTDRQSRSPALVQIRGPQPPISKTLEFSVDLIWARCTGPPSTKQRKLLKEEHARP
jgi:hypothetical protein